MIGRVTALLLLCLAVACSAKDGANESATAALHPSRTASTASVDDRRKTIYTSAIRRGVWYKAGRYRVRSLVSDAAIVPISDFPAIAYRKNENDFCGYFDRVWSTEARWVRSQGWRTSDDRAFGPIRLINVFRHYDYVGAMCYEADARIILFEHGVPIAAILSDAKAEGAINAFHDTDRGALRLENDLGDPPFGDLFLTGREIEIRPLPRADIACNGKTIVPNIFGVPIEDARSVLEKAGWKPITAPAPVMLSDPENSSEVEDDLDQIDLYKRGIKEVTECDPMGFCKFIYRSPKKEIAIVTYSGDFRVSAYDVKCEVAP